MAVQAPVFLDTLGFPVNGSSQDLMGMAPNSGFGLPEPFPNLVQPVQVNGLLNTWFLDTDGGTIASDGVNLQQFPLSNVLADEFEKQRREIDLLLQLQNEKFRSAIQQQKKKQITALLNSIESKTLAMLRKTEQDLAKVRTKTRELEDCLKRVVMETEAWKRTAKENEAMVVGLNNMLAQAQRRQSWAASTQSPAQDAESICECGGGAAENDKPALQENQNQIAGETGMGKMGCKWCKSQRSCMVFLPCKHLCACRECESLLGTCPVCKCVKEGSVSVFLG